METKHTPGPWQIDELGVVVEQRLLIAAAPELLEACQAMLLALGMNDGYLAANDPACQNARAAIAKATEKP